MVSMVILNYNDWQLTETYATNIEKMRCVDHVVVVDNCSTDQSFEMLKKIASDKIAVIKTDSNGGYAKGNNFGVDYVINQFGSNGIIIISNPDIEVTEDTIQILVNSMNDDTNLFAVTGLIYNAEDRLSPIFIWNLPTAPMLFINSSTILRNVFFKVFGYGTKIKKSCVDFTKDCIQCEAIPGCFFVADLKKWKKLGGFCSKTFLFYEEDILFSKAKKAGYKIAIVPIARIKHLEGVSIKKSLNSWKKREYLLADSCAVYMKECLNKSELFCGIYKFWNRLCIPERYLFYTLKKR